MAKKDIKADEGREETLDADHAEKRIYELGFHIDPELPEAEAKKIYQTLRDKMADIVAEGEPQKIPLAYTVSRTEQSVRRDFNSSYFGWIAYQADGPTHAAVIEMATEEGHIFRFLDLRTTKDAAQHSAEVHELMMKSPEKQEEEVSDVELDQALKEAGV